jgi:hypothetical protein
VVQNGFIAVLIGLRLPFTQSVMSQHQGRLVQVLTAQSHASGVPLSVVVL